MQNSVRSLSLFLLVMLITGAIDSIRNLPATALFGPTLIFFFLFSALVFLFPAGLISAELSSTWTEQGGIYDWVRMAFGEKIAIIAIWLQWINTMVWYPTILSFMAGLFAYVFDPDWASNKTYLVSVILVTFWGLTIVNFRGIRASARFAGICAVMGMVLPMILIIGLAGIWLIVGKPSQIHFTSSNIIPHLGKGHSWISLTAIMTAFLGMELATVHVRNVANAQKVFPKALLISVIFILATMVFGSLAIALVLPASEINLVDGVMQAFSAFFAEYHLKWLVPILTMLMLIGTLGGIINWIISPAKGMLRAAEHGYFPAYFAKENKHGVAVHLLVLQAILVTLVCFAFLLMPSVNGSYWLLTDLSTQLYMIMYVFMFLAALRLRYKYASRPRPFKIPGKQWGIWIVTLLGLFGCLTTLFVGFIPPNNSGIDVGTGLHYEVVFALGIVIMISPVIILYGYKAFFSRKITCQD